MEETFTGINVRFRTKDGDVLGYAINAIQHVNDSIMTFTLDQIRMKGTKRRIEDFRRLFNRKKPFDLEVYNQKKHIATHEGCHCISIDWGMGYGVNREEREIIKLVFAKVSPRHSALQTKGGETWRK